MSGNRVEGRVKWFDAEKGYGFIQRQGGSDVYIHIREVWQAGLDQLEEGELVTFTIRTNAKGPRAQEIEPMEKAVPGASELATTETSFTIDADYLAEGYFQDEEKETLRPEVLDEIAINVAKVLGNADPPTSMSQLRRFLDKARAIDDRLDRGASFDEMRTEVTNLRHQAAQQVERGLLPEVFETFIDRNVALAIRDERSFREGFLPHLQSVLEYFIYLF